MRRTRQVTFAGVLLLLVTTGVCAPVQRDALDIRPQEGDDAATAAAFRGFDLVEPIVAGRSSNGGKYVSYGVSVRLKDRAEMARFDACLPLVPGLKMVL